MKDWEKSLATQIGSSLREARISQGIDQVSVANYLGVHKSTISRYENGQTSISMAEMIKYCAAVEADTEEVFKRIFQLISLNER